MPSIHFALIGLSASAAHLPDLNGHFPYLLSARGQTNYTITALLTSSIPAAEKARSHFHLPESVKTHGSPATLATDPNIDLVAIYTRVDIPLPTNLPSLKAGKAFIE